MVCCSTFPGRSRVVIMEQISPPLSSRFIGRPGAIRQRADAVRTGGVGSECPQAFARANDHRWCLIIDRAGVWMPGDSKVLVRSPPVLVADVALANIARQYHDFFGRVK